MMRVARHVGTQRPVLWLLPLLLAACLALLPLPSFATPDEAADPYADAVAVSWEDGDYSVGVSLEGGSGRASVTSPAQLEVSDGKAIARVEWSSPNYDYMLVAGKRYLPVNTDGNSVFVIPVLAFDEPFEVVADTTAMSVPHEIEYALTFDSTSLIANGASTLPKGPIALAVAGIVCALILGFWAIRRRASQPH